MRGFSGSRWRWRRSALAVVLGSPCLLGACEKVGDPGQGGLVVIVETELALPKDLDSIRLEVTEFGRVLMNEEHEVGPDALKLPAAFRLPSIDSKNPILIRGVGSKDGTPRIQRDAVTPIPRGYVGELRLPLNYLCDGTAESDGSSTCIEDDETCILGTCAASEVGPEDIQPISGGASDAADAGFGECFDVSRCFEDAELVEVELSDCSIVVPRGADTDLVNVALLVRDGGSGLCDSSGCWVPQVRGRGGYQVEGNTILLPGGVCEERARLGFDVYMSLRCPSQTVDLPACAPWSSAGDAPSAPPPAVGEACTGPTSQACGACGTQTRTCRNGRWSEFGPCEDQGQCAPGENVDCVGGGIRSCGGNCEWSECSDDRCPGVGTRACGACGTETRTCDGSRWSDWSGCRDEGECTLRAVEPCAEGGVRACGGSCVWGECTAPGCEGPASQACAHCGTQSRDCEDGVWSDWSECVPSGDCNPAESRECGESGTQVCGNDCSWGECTDQDCLGAPSRVCGYCGTQRRACDNGEWSDWSNCSNEGQCQVNTTQSCGNGGIQTCDAECTWGECLEQNCDGEATQGCGNCGTQSRTCNNGVWSDWSACGAEGECAIGNSEACGEGGSRTCSGACTWGECLVADPPDEGGEGGSGGTSGDGDDEEGGFGGEGGAGEPDDGDGCPSLGGDMTRLPEGYCIDNTEVSDQAYEGWRLEAGQLTANASCTWKEDTLNPSFASAANLPAVGIDWCDAVSFCEAMGKRLCGNIGGGANPQADWADSSESQWFNACSAHGSSAFQYGNSYDADTCNASAEATGPIASGSRTTCQSPNGDYEGVFDLSGNVWEWEDSCVSGADFAGCLIRGGSWQSDTDSECSSASSSPRDAIGLQVGFRCCAD